MSSDDGISELEVRAELESILASSLFVQSERLGRFLRFTIEQTLAGERDSLKESLIGTQVYDRKPSYSPTQDSIVRTEARRLRTKLKEYYQGEGRDHPVFIYYRPGSYVPVFRYRESLDSGSAPDRKPAFPGEAGIPIAVIPFVALTDNPFAVTCALGISDELVHTLMRTDGCRVIAASSISQLISQAPDIPTLAHRLGAQIVFDGTVQQVEDRIRINGRIVSADGLRLWSQRFDVKADATSLFDIQERVVSALMTRTAPRQSLVRHRQSGPNTSHLSVYTDLLAAEELLEEGSIGEIETALHAFRRLARIAPDYARVHCGIAQCLIWQSQRGAPNSRELAEEAKSAATRALTLDEEMVEAHSALACTQAIAWEWEQAEATFQKAIAVGSHHAAFRQYASFLTSRRRFDEAWIYYQKSQRLDPFSHRQKSSLAQFFFMSGRYQQGLDHLVDVLRYGTVPNEVLAYQGLSLVQMGRYEEALALAGELHQHTAAQPLMQAIAGEIFASCGNALRARQVAEEIAAKASSATISCYRKASLALAMNLREEALSLLESSLDSHESELAWVKVDPRFLPIQKEERFERVVSAIG